MSAYRKAGYFLVAVKASVVGKRVDVTVIQGRITEKHVATGLGWFYSGLRGDDLTSAPLIRSNILASMYSATNGYQLHPSLSPAPNPDGTALTVTQSPLPGYRWIGGDLLFGNYGSRYTSSYLAGGSIYLNPGDGVQLTGGYTYGIPGLTKSSIGSNYYQANAGVSSITPWGTYGFTSLLTHYKLGKITAPYYFTGNVQQYTLTGSQLLYADASNRVSVNEGLSEVNNKETVLNGAYTLMQQDYDYYTLGASYTRLLHLYGYNGAASIGFNYNQGVSGYHGTFVPGPGAPSPHFHYLTFNLNYNQGLPLGMSLQLTGTGQWAFNTLPSNQLWVIGGYGNVSAYYSGIVSGDSGYAGRLALQSPAVHRYGLTATGSLFFETAGATSYYLSPHQAPWQNLSDAGLGINLSTRWGTTISAVTALPISTSVFPASAAANLSKDRIDAYFILQQSF
ncbi:ShlB/FhaC/HecB family hemolysin secretion/activation protein [Acidithiobacillus sp. MC6.1]|nr:ShlB/FhaC/HecB family hemolysin secretion/activation protein [Acidithiobacillus sp. MC6.1]